ncbi:hypothetical protein Y027_5081 [Burkholderia pseudomallei TSV5]|nr:hypothetical protein Y027_5081 [Burkholderia pseudomallei TSV5]
MRVSSLIPMPVMPFNTNDTVVLDTPASWATWILVMRLTGDCSRFELGPEQMRKLNESCAILTRFSIEARIGKSRLGKLVITRGSVA